MTALVHPDARITIDELENGIRRVEVQPSDAKMFSPLLEIQTAYPEELIRLLLDVKGPAWLCDEIARDEDPNYVRKHLEQEMRAYFRFDEMAGKRILDFGCGSGASTMCLARMFPESEIVGVELEPALVGAAEARRKHYDLGNVSIMRSPAGDRLPANVGRFDLVVMSAVYEHLLPAERGPVLRDLWSAVNDNGILFLNQTPHRYFPIELHTTSLPFINYLPDSLTLSVARRFSKRVESDASWEFLLRAGIRGATLREIKDHLRRDGERAELLRPTQTGLHDRVDLWFQTTNPENLRTLKLVARSGLKLINAVTGIALVPELSLAFRKVGG